MADLTFVMMVFPDIQKNKLVLILTVLLLWLRLRSSLTPAAKRNSLSFGLTLVVSLPTKKNSPIRHYDPLRFFAGDYESITKPPSIKHITIDKPFSLVF